MGAKMLKIVLLASATLLTATAAQATVATSYNATPDLGWFFGSGNDYSPANTAVLTSFSDIRPNDRDQIFLRFHQTGQRAPASNNGGVYSFALGTDPVSFDWGARRVNLSPRLPRDLTGLITITNVGTGAQTSYDPFASGNDNEHYNFTGIGVENSFRLNWANVGFDPTIDGLYKVNLSLYGFGIDGGPLPGTLSLDIYAKLGAGAVPEPATWAMMIGGFGMVGSAMRRRGRKPAIA
jgi:hypothetical protein